jgi:phosphatidylinositol kinase/protein kinase (PI-3  family)
VFNKNFSDDEEVKIVAPDNMSVLSLEILCNIMNYLHLRDLLKLDHQCRKLNQAVTMHLRVKKMLDFTEGELISWTSDRLSELNKVSNTSVSDTSIPLIFFNNDKASMIPGMLSFLDPRCLLLERNGG